MRRMLAEPALRRLVPMAIAFASMQAILNGLFAVHATHNLGFEPLHVAWILLAAAQSGGLVRRLAWGTAAIRSGAGSSAGWLVGLGSACPAAHRGWRERSRAGRRGRAQRLRLRSGAPQAAGTACSWPGSRDRLRGAGRRTPARCWCSAAAGSLRAPFSTPVSPARSRRAQAARSSPSPACSTGCRCDRTARPAEPPPGRPRRLAIALPGTWLARHGPRVDRQPDAGITDHEGPTDGPSWRTERRSAGTLERRAVSRRRGTTGGGFLPTGGSASNEPGKVVLTRATARRFRIPEFSALRRSVPCSVVVLLLPCH